MENEKALMNAGGNVELVTLENIETRMAAAVRSERPQAGAARQMGSMGCGKCTHERAASPKADADGARRSAG